MKFNWGHGLAIFIAIFVIAIFTMVFQASQESVDLVEKDYYPVGLNYQSQIDKLKRTNNLGQDISYAIKRNGILVSLPDTFLDKKINGHFLLYRPSDQNLDLSDTILLENSLEFIISSKKLSYGKYNLIVDVVVEEESYFFEKDVHLR